MSYSGETIAKKIARARLYLRVKQALDWRGVDTSAMKVIFLPGLDAAEVGALKHILKVRPENVIGVDRDPDACRALRARMPGAQTVNEDLETLEVQTAVAELLSYEKAKFVHLDLMGPMSKHSEILYLIWSHVCGEDGVMAVTYLRAREKSDHPLITGCLEAGKDMARRWSEARGEGKKLYKLMSADPERAFAHFAALSSCDHIVDRCCKTSSDLASSLHSAYNEVKDLDIHNFDEVWKYLQRDRQRQPLQFTPLATYSYQSTSPMGVLAAQRVHHQVLESDSYAVMRYDHGRHTSSVIRKDAMLDLLADADSLQKRFDREQVAEILDVSVGTLTAWRAHRTMDTYEK